MKFRLILALCIFFACSPLAPCSVRVVPIPESLQRPRITVLLNGAPVQGATIEIERQYKYPRHNKKLRRRLITDGKGQVLLPNLPYGLYRIVASAKPNLTADLYLNISPGEVGKEGLFSMDLQSFPSREQMLAADEQLSITKSSGFRGTVSDQSSASIPNVSIEIVQMGAQAKKRTIRLHSDAHGKFAAKLPDGDYVAVFNSPGFKQRTLHIAISNEENSSDLQVVLQVGDVTE